MSATAQSARLPRLVMIRLPPWLHFSSGHPHDLMWPVSMLYAAGLARQQGWAVTIHDLHVETLSLPRLAERVQADGPQLILIDSASPTLSYARELASRLKAAAPQTPIWAVGQHASAAPQDLLDADSPFTGCVRGEFEAAIGRLLAAGGAAVPGGIVGGITNDKGSAKPSAKADAHAPCRVTEPDRLPPLDPSGLLVHEYRLRSMHVARFGHQQWGFLHTSRGCPHACIFCSPTLRQSHGKRYRAQSAEQVVDDLARLNRDFGLAAFYMIDDLFSYDPQRVIDICAGIRRRKVSVSWCIQTRADLLDTDVLGALKASGCSGIKIGVEAGSDRILRLLRKGTTRDDLAQAGRLIRAAGIPLTACYMLGNPTETQAEMQETFALAQEIDADMIQVSFHTPYPGSESYERWGDQVKDDRLLSHYDAQAVNVSAMEWQALLAEHRDFYWRYYLSPHYLWRYLSRRAVYRLTDPDEWHLIWEAVRFWHWPKLLGGAPVSPKLGGHDLEGQKWS